jgi:hypothetical protein
LLHAKHQQGSGACALAACKGQAGKSFISGIARGSAAVANSEFVEMWFAFWEDCAPQDAAKLIVYSGSYRRPRPVDKVS